MSNIKRRLHLAFAWRNPSRGLKSRCPYCGEKTLGRLPSEDLAPHVAVAHPL